MTKHLLFPQREDSLIIASSMIINTEERLQAVSLETIMD